MLDPMGHVNQFSSSSIECGIERIIENSKVVKEEIDAYFKDQIQGIN